MGLEAVEIVLDVEEHFDIRIADDEASSLATPHDLYNLIAQKVELRNRSGCRTQRAFNLIRRHLMTVSGAPRSAVSPGQEIEAVLGHTDARPLWTSLRAELGPRALPRLSLSPSLALVEFLSMIVIGAACAAIISSTGAHASMAFAGFFIVAGLAGWILDRGMSDLRRVLPRDVRTVGALCSQVLARSPGSFRDHNNWSKNEIRETARAIIRSVLGLDEFPDDAHFVRDLGVG